MDPGPTSAWLRRAIPATRNGRVLFLEDGGRPVDLTFTAGFAPTATFGTTCSPRDAAQRVLGIVGNGHHPIIERLLRADPGWEVIEAECYLR